MAAILTPVQQSLGKQRDTLQDNGIDFSEDGKNYIV
jgi:hypothetical protein